MLKKDEAWDRGHSVLGESKNIKRLDINGEVISKSSYNDANSKYGWIEIELDGKFYPFSLRHFENKKSDLIEITEEK